MTSRPNEFPLDDLPMGVATRVDVDGTPVCVVRVGDVVYAIGDTCSHANVSLTDGEVYADDLEVECPAHGSVFSLVTGEPGSLPATQPVPVFDATVVGATVTIRTKVSPNTASPNKPSPNKTSKDHQR